MKHTIIMFLLVFVVATFLATPTAPTAKLKTVPVSPEALVTLGLTANSVSPGLPDFANNAYV